MADREQPQKETHRAYTVIRREGQDDFWLNIGLVFPHKDGKGSTLLLQALPLDGKIVFREITEKHDDENDRRSDRNGRDDRQQRRTGSGR